MYTLGQAKSFILGVHSVRKTILKSCARLEDLSLFSQQFSEQNNLCNNFSRNIINSRNFFKMAKRDDIDQFNAIVEYSCMDHYYVLFKAFFANHLAHAQVYFQLLSTLMRVVLCHCLTSSVTLDNTVYGRHLDLYRRLVHLKCWFKLT